MTFVILTAGIDLSVGSILALSTSLTAMALTRLWPETSYTVHLVSAVLIASLGATLAGAVNGAVIALLDIQPFIVTLASMIGIRGLTKWITQNANIDIGFGQDVAAQFASVYSSEDSGYRIVRRYCLVVLDPTGPNGIRTTCPGYRR